MKALNDITCRRCGSEDVQCVLTPDKLHFGKYVCNDCGKFIQWAKKPKNHSRIHRLAEIDAENKLTAFILGDESGELLAREELDRPLESGDVMQIEWTIVVK